MTTDPRRKEESYEGRFRELERRLADLERMDRMPYSSQKGGTFQLLDAAGVARFFFGDVQVGGGTQVGVAVQNEDSTDVFAAGDDGLAIPYVPISSKPAGQTRPFTSSNWTTAHAGRIERVVSSAILVTCPVYIPTGTSGEIRIRYFTTNGATQTLVENATNTYTWTMLTPDGLLGAGPVMVYVDVRRTGGAGEILVYDDTYMHQVSSALTGATASGI